MPLVGIVALPFLIVAAPLLVLLLRTREEPATPSSARARCAADLEALQELEDRDLTNQYTAIGAVKPGSSGAGC